MWVRHIPRGTPLAFSDSARIGKRLFDAEVVKSFDRASEDRSLAADHDGSLYEVGVPDHEFDELLVRQIFAGDMIAIVWFVLPDGVLRFQSGEAQQLLELCSRERLVEVVDGFKVQSVFSQGTLDLATGASGGFFVDGDFVGGHRVSEGCAHPTYSILTLGRSTLRCSRSGRARLKSERHRDFACHRTHPPWATLVLVPESNNNQGVGPVQPEPCAGRPSLHFPCQRVNLNGVTKIN